MYLMTRLFTVSVLVAGLVIPFKSFAATLEECNAALLAGDYAKGIEFFQPRAEKGDAMAQFHVGFIHMHMTRDPRVPPDYAEVAKWYRKAAEQGNSCAQNGLGLLYADGHGVPKVPTVLRYWNKAVDAPSPTLPWPAEQAMSGLVPNHLVPCFPWRAARRER